MDEARSIKALDDGGAVICGSTGSFGTQGGDMYVLRIDVAGQIVWSTILGGAGVEAGQDIVALPDGGFLAIGSTNSFGEGGYDGFVVRLSETGENLWQRTYGTPEWDFFYAGVLNSDGVLLTGQTFGMGAVSGDLLLVRTDLDGEEEWMHSYGTQDTDEARSILDLGMDGCLLAGTTGLGEVSSDAYLFRIGPDGDAMWSTALGGENTELGYDIIELASGGFVVSGYTQGFNPVRQMFLGKITDAGDEVWTRTVSSAGDDWEARSVMEKANGDLVLAGYTEEYGAGAKDVSLLFVNAQGDFLSGPTYGGFGSDEAWSLDATSDGGFYIAGSTDSFGSGMEAVFVVRSDGDTLNGTVTNTFDHVGLNEVEPIPEMVCFPVPSMSGSVMTIAGFKEDQGSIFIYDARGTLVSRMPYRGGKFQLPALSPGPYEIHFLAASGSQYRSRTIIY